MGSYVFHSCQVTAQPKIKYEPVKMSEIPKNPCEKPVINSKGPFPMREHLLVLFEYRPRYSVMEKLKEIY